MNRSLPLLFCVVLAAPACNDDPVFFPFASDTATETDAEDGDATVDVAEDVGDDTSMPDVEPNDVETDVPATDAGEVDAELDAEPDTDESDASEFDAEPDTTEPDVEPDAPGDDVSEPDVEPEVCEPGAECDGGICGFQTVGCGFDPQCIAGCTADEEVNVCGCDGVVARQNPLCSTVEFAYELDGVDQRAELEGAECDPLEFGRLRYSANISFTDMDFFVGQVLHIRVPSNWDDSFVIEERIVIESASFEIDVPTALDTDLFGWFFEWYIDVDEDGTCDFPDELSWSHFESNPFGAGPVFVELSATDEFDEFACEFWDSAEKRSVEE